MEQQCHCNQLQAPLAHLLEEEEANEWNVPFDERRRKIDTLILFYF
jgi:hypothetical protein